MAGICDYRNPFQRPGISQQERLLKALVPSYARIDERDYADLILFAKEYCRYLNYFNDAINEDRHAVIEPDGDWTPFMKMDLSVTLATLNKLDGRACFNYLDYLISTILQTDSFQLAELKKLFTAIYEFLFSLVYWLDEEWLHLPGDFAFTEYAGNMIKSRLNEMFYRVKHYYEKSNDNGLISTDPPLSTLNAPINISSIPSLLIKPLSEIWKYKPLMPFTFYVEGSNEAEEIKYIVQHSIFKGTIESFLKGVTSLSQKAGDALEATINSYPNHAPHYALYLTFIKLFRYAQTHLNDYTGRHLNFYYKKVLQLKNSPAEPDNVHLVLELAKQTTTRLLAKDTVFKAGKDVDGVEIFYAASDDVLLNKGQVVNIQSVYSKKQIIAGVETLEIFEAPITNSGDGKGGDIITADKSWKPFGDPLKNVYARTGFAIAHSILYMKEGTRTITLTIKCSDVSGLPPAIEMTNWFEARLTSVKGWTIVTISEVAVFLLERNVTFTVVVENDKPAIVPYDEKLHAAGYVTELPVMEFTINTSAVHHDPHLILKLLQVRKINITIDVIGVKDVSIQNEISVLDPAKPFEIFGPPPHVGSTFIIGSKEIFLKNSDAVVEATVTIEWDKLNINESGNAFQRRIGTIYPPDTIDWSRLPNKNINIYYLKDGAWAYINQTTFFPQTSTGSGLFEIKQAIRSQEQFTIIYPLANSNYDFSENAAYDINSKEAFIKLEFIGPTDFGHGDFIQRFTEASLKNNPSIPSQPYTPTIKSLSIDYTASADMNPLNINNTTISDKEGHFYHLLPFGHAEQHTSITGAGSILNLLPSFNNEGELYIGIDQFAPDQSIQILFQLSEGSANPLKDPQIIQWHYLSANNLWQQFLDKNITDATNNLTISGIIKFGFPHDATSDTSVFASKLFWIRGVVEHDTDAVCNIIQLHAQAVKAQFNDYLQKGNFYKHMLPALTISKLVISDAAIKKIQQPYSSFGGRAIENDQEFHVRVSERLRHKNRGITMWDYEHLVLQNFPEIYKVKCINHAQITLSGNIEYDNEMAPGHTLVVPIPDLRNKNAIDPLKPMTSIGTLNNIELFLKTHISPFVKLQVKNARFEEIQLDFRVKFNSDDGAYYHDVLEQEIEAFLSPWAYDAVAGISFGGSMYKSVLLNFVEERPYVDYVTCFKMYHYVDGVHKGDTDEAIATSARTVLISYSNPVTLVKHIIDYINYDCICS